MQIKCQTKLPKDLFLTTSFKTVTTEWTLVKYDRAEGQKVLPQSGTQKRKEKLFHLFTKRRCPAGTGIQCSAANLT